MEFKNAELTDMIEAYSKATNTPSIVDSTVRGKITNLNEELLTREEALNYLSRSLALNGYSWIKINDKYIVRNARSAQRDSIPTYKTLPPAEPEHMASYLYTLKNTTCEYMQSNMSRLLTSSYGEMTCLASKNTIVATDFTGSLQRIHTLLNDLDALPNVKAEKAPEKNNTKKVSAEKIKTEKPSEEQKN